MICLTGDVHDMSLKTKDQIYLSGTEVDSANRYLQIAEEHDVNITLFITGRCVDEEPSKIREISKNDNTELGGHTYNCFRPEILYKFSNKFLGLRNGPAFMQKRDIRKTISVFKTSLGLKPLSWRDHGYRHDRNTVRMLKKTGIRFFSDEVTPDCTRPFEIDDMCHVPINVLPDHDYIYHGSRMPGTFNENNLLSRPFRSKGMSVDDWFRVVKEQVKKITSSGGLATILAHPACMEISDNFKTFEHLCGFLSEYETIKMKDISCVQ